MGMKERQTKVFVSHSSGDADYVKAIVELLEDIGLGEGEIFCSSVDAYKIPLGKSIYDYLAEQFQNYNLHVLFVLSKNYYDSVASLNEMGAAWVLKHRYDAILLPGMQFEDVRGCIDKNQISIKLDSEEGELQHRLNEFQKNMVEEFSKPPLNMSKWERNRAEFLHKVRALMADNAKAETAAETDKNKESEEVLSLEAAVLLAYASEDQGEIIVIRDILGTHVQAGIWELTGAEASARTIARWEAAVEELLRLALIKRTGRRDRIYGVTHRGYEAADVIKKELNFKETESPDTYLGSKIC